MRARPEFLVPKRAFVELWVHICSLADHSEINLNTKDTKATKENKKGRLFLSGIQ